LVSLAEVLNAPSLQALEPHLAPAFSHALWVKDAASVDNPRAVVKAYASAVFGRRAGTLVQAQVRVLAAATQWLAMGEPRRERALDA
jgi:D-amino-acid dehydrogenase